MLLINIKNRDADTIVERIKPWMTHLYTSRYKIVVVNDFYDKQYNFYLVIYHPQRRTRAVPLHSVHEITLAQLETLIQSLSQQIHLTIDYRGFAGKRWPKSQKFIQRKKLISNKTL